MTIPLPLPAMGAIAALLAGLLLLIGYRIGKRRANRAAAELQQLNAIGLELLRAPLDLDTVCQLVYRRTRQLIDSPSFQLGLFEGEHYHVQVWVRDDARLPETRFEGVGRKGIIGWVRETGQHLLVRDFEAEREQLPAVPSFDLEHPPRSGLFVPLIAGEETIGVIAVQSKQARHFDSEQARLLTALATQAAWAIRNAQVFERAALRADQLRLINDVTARVSALQPLPDLFSQLVKLIKEKFGYYSVSIFVQRGGVLRVAASTSEALQQAGSLTWRGLITWVVENGRSALANDVSADQRYTHLAGLPDTKSEIALPLTAEGRVLGILDVQSNEKGAFEPEDVLMLETLAAQVAIAILQASTYQEQQRLAERLQSLVRIGQVVVSVLDLDDLLDRVVDVIGDSFGYERVHIFVRSGNQQVFRAGAGAHTIRWLIEGLHYDLDDRGLIPTAARQGEALLVGDVTHSKEYRPGPELDDTRSELVIPIKMAGRVLGVIDLQSREKDAFSKDDLVLMQALADTVAVAIRNATLYAAERDRRNLAETLRLISQTLLSDLDLQRVLEAILAGLEGVVALENAALFLVDEGSDGLVLAATAGSEALSAPPGSYLPPELLDLGDEIDEETAITHLYHVLLELGQGEEGSSIVAPLSLGEETLGYLMVHHRSPQRYFPIDQETVVAFANQAAIAINNARLYEAVQAEAYVTTVLLQVAEAASARHETNEALEAVARLLVLLAGVHTCVVFSYEASDRRFSLAAAAPGLESSHLELDAGSDPLMELLTVTDSPLLVGQDADLQIPSALLSLVNTEHILAFPLRTRRGLVGALIVDEPPAIPDRSRMMSILTGVAHQIASLLEAAHLQAGAVERERLEQEIAVARSIQASFIPDAAPSLEGWALAARWRAARQVSGDFYDFIPLRDGRYGLVIADVADKGFPAALFMAMCRTLLRAVAITHTDPAVTLQRVNDLLISDAASDLFVTMLYVVWNPETGQVSYGSAGHNPPLLLREAGGVEKLPCKGMALGIIPGITIQEFEIMLEPGDTLIAYTDGVTEAMQRDYAEYGIERFVQLVGSHKKPGADTLVDAVVADVDAFVGGAPQSDDLTIWVLQRQKALDVQNKH